MLWFRGREYKKESECSYMCNEETGEKIPVCDFCQFAKQTGKYSGESWCWKKFKIVSWGSGCNKFRCMCLRWKNKNI